MDILLKSLIDQAQVYGLGIDDINNARDFLFYHEYGLCFDTIVTQIFEYDIPISREYYKLISDIGEKLKIDRKNYDFVKELVE